MHSSAVLAADWRVRCRPAAAAGWRLWGVHAIGLPRKKGSQRTETGSGIGAVGGGIAANAESPKCYDSAAIAEIASRDSEYIY